jgi:riboflavin synthase
MCRDRMFTGLVECVGTVVGIFEGPPRLLTIAGYEASIGESVAVDGCCLTVVARTPALSFEAGIETLRRTTLGRLRTGDRVNIEGATRAGDRLGGHLVTGHIDGVGTVASRRIEQNATYVTVTIPGDLAPLVAAQGSVAMQGVSLTVTAVTIASFSVMLIPHTLAATTLCQLAEGSAVNIEVDLVARYVQRLLQFGRAA